MKKHYLISAICLPLCLWWLTHLQPGDNIGLVIALLGLFTAYPFMINYLNKELDKEHEENESPATDNAG